MPTQHHSRKPTKPIDPRRLVDVTDEIVPGAGGADEAYVDRKRGVVVQVWHDHTPGCIGTPWEGTLQVAVKRSGATTIKEFNRRGTTLPITWDDLQAIKDHFWPTRIGLEVFPPYDKIVNVADMRWLWVLPQGAVLPFNLQGDAMHALKS